MKGKIVINWEEGSELLKDWNRHFLADCFPAHNSKDIRI